MRSLEELPMVARLGVAVGIVASVLIVLSVTQIESQVPELKPSAYDKRMVELERVAAEQAFREQIQHLFATWMKDETGQPNRALTGARRAQGAYVSIMTRLDERERALSQP